ncbi:MAG: extracellular solute-binding protein [Oscillospiraceae bacterium]|nr:extracellular solute-binding protein [Oscillospiraceae bacterium]
METSDITVDPATAQTERLVTAHSSAGNYSEYIYSYKDKQAAANTVTIPVMTYKNVKGEVKARTDIPGGPKNCLFTGEESSLTWEFSVPTEGLYGLLVTYYTAEGKGSAIERSLYLDEALPFTEAETLTFSRAWEDSGEIITDYQGNEVRPSTREIHAWRTQNAKDSSGYYDHGFQFYLSAGVHNITLSSVREPMIIGGLAFTPLQQAVSYKQRQKEYQDAGYKKASINTIKIQAENMLSRSDKSIYPTSNKSSAAIEPESTGAEKLNILDSSKFKLPGQWVRWELQVEESGLYQIAVRYLQSERSGAYCSRKLLIDGELPFAEAASLKFAYNDQWNVQWLSDDNGTPYQFYLEAGTHVLEMQVSLGEMAEMIKEVESILTDLNESYREIFVITGSNADKYRDYHFTQLIPETLADLAVQRDRLKRVLKTLEQEVGDSGSFTSVFTNIIFDTSAMVNKPRKLASKMEAFKSDLGALGEWLQSAINQPVTFDWIWAMSPAKKLPDAEKGFLAEMIHHIRLFGYSFTADYSDIGKIKKGDGNSIKVWVTSGRDQSKIIRRMIDQDFTPSTGISVDLQLVAGGTLLRSVLAGNGPDIAMQLGVSEPLNYALRKAVLDLKQFDDYETVVKRFNSNAVNPYEYMGAVYALPETFSYPMMFYRTDIFEKMGLRVPKTWDEVDKLIVLLSASNMKFGLPFNTSTLVTMLVQNGVKFYNDDRTEVNLVSDEALQTFSKWTSYYHDYGLDVSYDFSNRFRTGEMPIGIIDFVSTYNQLSVFAPEIKGQWTFVEVPGTSRADGTIDHTAIASGVAISIMSSANAPADCWKYLKWWTDTNAQVDYGTELESILGAAARYASANEEAVARTAWPVETYQNIMRQWKYADCLPEAPGSYIIGRYVDFAAKAVINNNANPGQTMIKYTKLINSELDRKNKEFFING